MKLINKKILIILLFLFFFFLFNINECFALSGYVNLNSYVLGFYPTNESSISINIEGLKYEGSPIANIISYYDTIYIKSDFQNYMLEEYNVNLSDYTYYGFRYDPGGYGYAVTIWLSDSEYVSKAGVGMCPSSGNPFITLCFFIANNHSNDGQFSLTLYSSYTNTDTRPIYSNMTSIGSYKVGDLVTDFPFTSSSFPTPTQNYTLYIDDFNFMKRFKFQFKIPLLKEDTKVFCFLEKYTRNNYNSVTANFKIYTVSTPEGYDYTNYKNYMYYDNEDKKLYLPAGCIIERYNCTANNGELYSLNHETTYTAKRDIKFLYHNFEVTSSLNNIVRLSFNGGFTFDFNEDSLIPTSIILNDFDGSSFLSNFAKLICNVPSIVKALPILEFNSLNDYFYYEFSHLFYYGYNINYSFEDNSNIFGYNFSDFVFGTSSICSYENTRYITPTFTGNFYNYLRRTKVYTMNNKINDYTFRINYSDSQDVTSMLPEGTDTDYLTSPFYKGNENSSSGGNITYDIQEVIQGDKIIDYSKDDNSIHNDINNTYIENWNEGDNIVINTVDNPSIDKIYKTSQDILGILRLLYTSVLHIETKLGQFSDLMSNTTNNFTYNTTNQIEYLFVPNKAILKDDLQKMSDETDEHLGILAQGTDFLLFVGTLYYNIDDPEQIVLHIPKISIWEHTLIPETTFNFTSFMTNDLPFLGTMHNMYLTAVDLFFLWILIGFAEKIYNKFTGNGGE